MGVPTPLGKGKIPGPWPLHSVAHWDQLSKQLAAVGEATDIPGAQTIMPWKGIRFDATGQNVAATPVIQQIKDGKYHTIYPFDVAAQDAVWSVGQ